MAHVLSMVQVLMVHIHDLKFIESKYRILMRLDTLGSGNGVVYLTSPGRPTEIGLQLGKACYPCSR